MRLPEEIADATKDDLAAMPDEDVLALLAPLYPDEDVRREVLAALRNGTDLV